MEQTNTDRKAWLGLLARAPEGRVAGLLAEESRLEASRRAGAADYCVMRHIDILIAVMAEAQILPRRPHPAPEPAHAPVPQRV